MIRQHKAWFDVECSQFLDQRKQAKMQWLQDPNQSDVDNLNNLPHEASKKVQELKEGISESQN
jgi:hypothetical protein